MKKVIKQGSEQKCFYFDLEQSNGKEFGELARKKHVTVKIRYFNVVFYLKIKDEKDIYNYAAFDKVLASGLEVHTKDIHRWCKMHGIEYHSRFYYRGDKPLDANMYNFYSYIRFLMERSFWE